MEPAGSHRAVKKWRQDPLGGCRTPRWEGSRPGDPLFREAERISQLSAQQGWDLLTIDLQHGLVETLSDEAIFSKTRTLG